MVRWFSLPALVVVLDLDVQMDSVGPCWVLVLAGRRRSRAAFAEVLLSSSLDLLFISGILVCQRSESLPSWFHV